MMAELPDGVVRLELAAVGDVGSISRTTNAYLLLDDRPALIGAGHPTNNVELLAQLSAHGVRAADIERIVVGSWAPDVLGGSAAFPRADVFVTSPDMIQPRSWNAWCDARRARILGVADEVFERVDAWGRAELDPWLRDAFPRVSNHLDFIPLRTGHTVRAGALDFEIVGAPGPHPGHAFLWNADLSLCFCGELELDGLPTYIESAQDYLVAVERGIDLAPQWLLPSHTAPNPHGRWTLKAQQRFVANYFSNMPSTLSQPKTLLEVVDTDLGHLPEHPAPYIEAILRHRAFLEELVLGGMIRAEGAGLDRRYSAS